MKDLVAVLAFVVAGEYALIAVFVVPRLARIAKLDRVIVSLARWGATAFFLGCAITHTMIALQTLDPGLPGGMDMAVRGGDTALLFEMVLPHIAQIVGGAVFIYIAVRRLEVSITSKDEASQRREVDRQFRSAFDRAPLGFALLATDGHTRGEGYVNPAYLEIYGLDPHGSVPSEQDLLDRVHPDDRAAVAESVGAGAGAPLDLQFRVVRPDGAVRWIHSRQNPIAADNGAVTRLTNVVEDVTDRVDAHAALAHSERRLVQLADSVTVGINLRQLHPPRFLWGNAAYVEIMGADPVQDASTDADPALASIHPDDHDRVLKHYWPLAQAGEVATSEHRIRRPDGEVRWVHATSNPMPGEDGTVNQIAGTVQDITARKHAEVVRAALLRGVSDTLAASTQGLDEIAQSVVDLAVAVLGDGAVLRVLTPDYLRVERDVVAHRYWSERNRLTRVVKRTAGAFGPDTGVREEVIQRGRLVSSISGNDRLAEFKLDVSARVDAEVEHLIVAPVRHDGAVLGLLSVYRSDPATPYEAGDDDLVQVLADRIGAAVMTYRAAQAADAEELQRRAAAERLQELTDEQRELYAQLANTEARERALLAEAVHDDPLQLIVSAILRLDLLRAEAGTTDGEELDEVATLLETSVDQLRHLIVALTPPDLSDGLGPALLHLAEGIFIGTTTRVHVTGLSHVHLTLAAKGAAYRIVREALVNARKHARASTVTLDLREVDDQVVLGVTDDGVGAATLDAGRGHLGLATMHARANSEGAQLSVHSTPGLGTAVALTMPCSTIAPAGTMPALEPGSGRQVRPS